MKKTTYIILFFFITIGLYAQGDVKKSFTLADVISLAKDQSPDAIVAKHRFRASYWEMRSYKAELLPALTLNGSLPNYQRSYSRQFDNGKEQFFEQNNIFTQAGLSLTQNIGLTGGNISVTSSLERIDDLNADEKSYLSNPVIVRLEQPINGYNELKWKRKIEPKRYEEAKRSFVRDMEQVSSKAVKYFFDLMVAQQNMSIADVNLSNADTLFKIAKGRYNIGTIAENELLQMELSFLNAGADVNDAKIQLESNKFRLRSFLGFNNNVDIELIIEDSVPSFTVDFEKALSLALEKSPEVTAFERQILEAKRDVAKAQAQRGISANLFASFGLTKRDDEFKNVYNSPEQQQGIRLGVSLPILDWGRGRGRVQMAKSQQELINTEVEQGRTDFKQRVFIDVMGFNMRNDQVLISGKADTIAQKRYMVTKQRFLIGKINVTDLNISQTEKDKAKNRYIESLRSYWDSYYNLRKLTLFDFVENKDIKYDYTKIVD